MIELLREQFSGYGGVLLLCAFSGLGVPVPEDVAVLFAGTRIGTDGLGALPTAGVVWVGLLFRDLLAYGIGRLLGAPLLDHRWTRRLLGAARIERAQGMLADRGPIAVLFARFLIGVRVPVFVVTGAARVPVGRFLAWDALGLLMTVPIGLTIGALFGPPLLDWAARVVGSASAVVATLVAIGLALVAFRAWRRRKVDPGPESP